MTPKPIDLATLAGKRFRLAYDEARQGRDPDPWLVQIPCQYGHIYPHSGKLLGIATNGRAMGIKLAKLPGVTVLQEGDDGFNLACPVSMFGQVAKIMGAKRRRQVSETERQRLAAIGKATRLTPRKAGVQSAKSTQNRPQPAPVDTLAV